MERYEWDAFLGYAAEQSEASINLDPVADSIIEALVTGMSKEDIIESIASLYDLDEDIVEQVYDIVS